MTNIIKKFKTCLVLCLVAIVTCTSCHDDTNTEKVHVAPDTDTMSNAPSPAAVVVATNDSLKMGVNDAIKDYPGVKATTDYGEITLTGDIARPKLQGLLMTLHTLHPKKINNNLTIK